MSGLGLFGIFAAGFIIVLTIIYACIYVYHYANFNRCDSDAVLTATLTWDMFKSMYEVNPNDYEIDYFNNDKHLYYIRRDVPTDNWYSYKKVYIFFKTIFDYVAANHYFNQRKKNKEKNDLRQQEIAGLEALQKLTQQDIERIQKQVDKEFEQAKKTVNKVSTNLKKPTIYTDGLLIYTRNEEGKFIPFYKTTF